MKMHKNCCHHRAAHFGADMDQIVCQLGLRTRPHWGSLQRSPDPLAGLGVGPPGEGKEEKRGKGGRVEERRKRKGVEGRPHSCIWGPPTI